MLKRTIEEAVPTVRMHFTQDQQDAIENGRRSHYELVNEIKKLLHLPKIKHLKICISIQGLVWENLLL